jgi:23S rRNA pseudouridine955/2504/2580 synthase
MSKQDAAKESARVRWLTVSGNHDGQRLDNYLLRELPGVPRTRLYRALRKGEVRVNKGRKKADYRVCEGDVVRLPPLHQPQREGPPPVPGRWQKLLDRVIYEDAGLLVIDKPSGLAVHGGSGLSIGLIECLRQLRPRDDYLELVHRLDRETSGCLLIAKRPAVLRDLHRQLREDTVEKRYLALVAGDWPRKLAFVEAPLSKNTVASGERIVRVERGGKAARTEFTVRARYPGHTLLEARPVTGRTHQIRVHARHAGFPLLGDEKYGDRAQNQAARERGLKRLFLHAESLAFDAGERGRLTVEAPLDPELRRFLDAIDG